MVSRVQEENLPHLVVLQGGGKVNLVSVGGYHLRVVGSWGGGDVIVTGAM